MNRRSFLRLLPASAALSMRSASAQVAGEIQRRGFNVVLILVDDLGATDLACYGSDLHETPNLDSLAAQSVRFTHAYAAAPVCSPTRASILTGKHPARLGITIWSEGALNPPTNRKLRPADAEPHLSLSEFTLAEAFRGRGYRTAHIGKWHLGDAHHYPEQQGFDVHIGGTLWGAPQTFFYPWRGDKRYGGEPRYVPGIPDGKPGDYLPDKLTQHALGFLDASAAQPFFLNLWYYTVHTPIEGKPDLVAYYQKKLRQGLNHQNAAYAAMVHNMDENVGRILRKLDELGIADRTVVLFTSDNGGFINEFEGQAVTTNAPLRSGKGSLYEGGIRVPLMVRGPGLRSGATVSERVASIDFYPTLLDLTEIPLPAQQAKAMDGRSFAPLLRESQHRLAPRPLFFHFPHYYPTTTPASAILDGDWKLIEYFEDGRLELYNLRQDPSEKTDLAAREPARAISMLRQLREWRGRVGARLPSPLSN